MKSNVERLNGVLKININGEIFDPYCFKSFRPTKRNISEFYEAGTKLFCVLSTGMKTALDIKYSTFGESWLDDETYDFSKIDDQIDLFIECAPNAYLMPMLQVDTREWWLEKRPNYESSYWNITNVCNDPLWRDLAGKYLKRAIEHIEEKYGDRVFGYFVLGGGTTEWISTKDHEIPSDIKINAFKNSKYRNFDIPSKEELFSKTTFTNPLNKNVYSYRKFSAESVSDTICYFADIVKKTTNNNKLAGVYFGYVMELGLERLLESGHNDYETVYKSHAIDMIAFPSAYSWPRRPEGTSAYMTTVDTLNENNKICFLEFDHRTCCYPLQLNIDKKIPGETERISNEPDTIDVMRRDLMLALTKGIGMYYFDMFEGSFYSKKLMEEIKKSLQIVNDLRKIETKSISEVAVIVDSDSLYHTGKYSDLNGELLVWLRVELAKINCPFDCFSFCSLDKANFDQYKLIIFPTCFSINKEKLDKINKVIKNKQKHVLWLYAPGFIDGEKFSLENMKTVTGFDVELLDRNENIVVSKNDKYGFSYAKDETFFVKVKDDIFFADSDEEVEVLGRYQGSLRPALVRREFNGFTSIYSAGGYVTAPVLQMIAKDAGCHIYCDDIKNSTYVSSALVGLYQREKGISTLNLKEDGSYVDIFSGKTYETNNKKIVFTYNGESRAILLINKKVYGGN